MKNFIKENWFKIITIAIVVYTLSLPFELIERKLWADERLESYKKCLEHISFDNSFNVDGYKLSFRSCKVVSDNF